MVNHELRFCLLASRLAFQLQAFGLQKRLNNVVRPTSIVVQIDAMTGVGLDVGCKVA